jgi:hypothetical protein
MYIKKYGGRLWIGLIWLRIGQVVGFCKLGNKHSDFINGGFLD